MVGEYASDQPEDHDGQGDRASGSEHQGGAKMLMSLLHVTVRDHQHERAENQGEQKNDFHDNP